MKTIQLYCLFFEQRLLIFIIIIKFIRIYAIHGTTAS